MGNIHTESTENLKNSSKILNLAKEKKAKFYIQFGGQGLSFISELQALYADPLMADYFDVICDSIATEMSSSALEHPEFYTYGFDIKKWLENPKKMPPVEYLRKSFISAPLIFTTQIGHYYRFLQDGINAKDLISFCGGVYGHSQGVNSALLVGMGLDGKEFLDMAGKFVKSLFWLGYRSLEAFPDLPLDPFIKKNYVTPDDNTLTPMAAISGMPDKIFDELLQGFNKELPLNLQVFFGLRNTQKVKVVVGAIESLLHFRAYIIENEPEYKDSFEFVQVSFPFHSELLRPAVAKLQNDFARISLNLKGSDFILPVFDTRDGKSMQSFSDVSKELASISITDFLDWGKTISSMMSDSNATHILSFGPSDTADRMTSGFIRGKGIQIVNLTSTDKIRTFLYSDPLFAKKWTEFQPVVAELPDGRNLLLNEFSKYTGRSPVFGGGMTPSTVEIDMVVAAANNAQIVEWAGGGQVTEEMLLNRLDKMTKALKPGEGIILNLLFLDAYLWNFQYPLVKKLKKQGYPIEGVTISAGIPDLKQSVQYLNELHEAGLWLNAFKPGTNNQIQQVIDIAKEIPHYKIIMQVEGGSAGGHHSWENLQLLIKTNYHKIREQQNIILVVGGGISSEEEAAEWILGTWNISPSGKENTPVDQLMPVDGVFLGTRLMAAKECQTSEPIKKALVTLEGGSDWEKTKEGNVVGGIISGKSGLGADIYYAETSWSKLSIFAESLVKGKENEEAIENVKKNRDKLIEMINKTAKPFFGDVESMSYMQVLDRFIELVCPGKKMRSPEGEWLDAPFIDSSFRKRLFILMQKFEERVTEKKGESMLLSHSDLNDPIAFVKKFYLTYPGVENNILPEDVLIFLDICHLPGKPVNFIPVIDENIIKWIRSDSLWYSHVIDMDPDKCAWIPGPVAVKGIKKINEPVTDIISNFEKHILNKIKNNKIKVDSLRMFQPVIPDKELQGIKFLSSDSFEVVGNTLLSGRDVLATISKKGNGLLSILLNSDFIVRDSHKIKSDLFELASPLLGRVYAWEIDEKGNLTSLIIAGKNKAPEMEFRLNGNIVEFALYFVMPDEAKTRVPFIRKFSISQQPYSLVHEDVKSENSNVRNFYAKVWQLGEVKEINLDSKFKSKFNIPAKQIYQFRLATNELNRKDFSQKGEATLPSLNMAIVYGWKSMMQTLFLQEADGNIFKLLHLNHSFEWKNELQLVSAGDELESVAEVIGLSIRPNGKELKVAGDIFKGETKVASFQSAFYIRGDFSRDEVIFLNKESKIIRKTINTKAVAELIKSLEWIKLKKDFSVSDLLEFRVSSRKDIILKNGKKEYFASGKIFSYNHSGLYETEIGAFDTNSDTTNQFEILMNHTPTADENVPLEHPYRIFSDTFTAPIDMNEYSAGSLDYNPIHTDRNFAVFAGLPGVIVHGMWTSSQAVRSVLQHVCLGDAERLISFFSSFESPVLPGEKLIINAVHTSLSKGNLNLEIEIKNLDGKKVYSGKAIVKAPGTAYIFTGQGSQAQGMGMKFMEKFPQAREVWEKAEKVTTDQLGFSLLQIVRDNPQVYPMADKVWQHPKGVLNLTQFTQVGLVVKALADWAVLKSEGNLVPESPFAGHSLGEYSALACREMLDLESVIKIVYHRGLTMQNLVPRDESGKSPFGMSVVMGNRHIGMNEAKILQVVDEIRKETGKHLEVVNLNIRDKQYSVTGYLDALEAMEKKMKSLARGHRITIRLAGIDVPFHSSILSGGVPAFRSVLEKNIKIDSNFDELEKYYIPNLVAKPFKSDKEFIELVYKTTKSEVLKSIIDKGIENYKKNEVQRKLLVELLAYQFANPVQWIRTQDVIFDDFKVKRVIDIGARGDLAGMARQTLKDYQGDKKPLVFHIEENQNQVFYELDDVAEVAVEKPAMEVEEDKPVIAVEATQAVAPEKADPVREVVSTPQVNSPSLSDTSLSKISALKAILSIKASVRQDEIQDTDTIDKVFSGNSSKRNQAMADIGAEFNTTSLDGAHEKTIKDVAAILDKGAKYDKPGPFLRVAFEEVLKNFMPPGFGRTEIFKHLSEERMMAEGHVFSFTNFMPLIARTGDSTIQGTLSPIGLGKRFSNAKEALAWIDQAVDQYGKSIGVAIPYKSVGSGGGSSGGAMVDSLALAELEKKYFGIEGTFYKILQYSRAALNGEDPYLQFIQKDKEILDDNILETFKSEHGKAYDRALQSKFEEKKIIIFKNSSQWAKKNLVKGFWSIVNGEETDFNAWSVREITNNASENLLATVKYFKTLGYKETKAPLDKLEKKLKDALDKSPVYYPVEYPAQCKVEVSAIGSIDYTEIHQDSFTEFVSSIPGKGSEKGIATILTTEDSGISFSIDKKWNEEFLNTIKDFTDKGVSFKGKTALVTGAGAHSIALEVVKNLLAGGMNVIVTTSSYNDSRINFYKRVFQENGAIGSSLILVPFSQGSSKDIKELVSYVIRNGYHPDVLIPFGAIGEENTLTSISGESLASVKVMLYGVNQLIGELAKQFEKKAIFYKKFKVILPLSPNHGIFGRDGFYAETKIGLEALFKKWYSEHDDWGKFCQLIGCRIGWVRGTGLMEMNNIVAPDLEKKFNVKTFNQNEMGVLLTALYQMAEKGNPENVILADLTGGLGEVKNLNSALGGIRSGLLEEAKTKKELFELKKIFNTTNKKQPLYPSSKATIRYNDIPTTQELKSFGDLTNLNLEKLICIVGYSEIGTGGSSVSRWELEKDGEFSIEAVIELAWMTGLIEYQKTQSGYGWVDISTGELIPDWEIKKKYESQVIANTGIRVVNPEASGFDPLALSAYTNILLEEDFFMKVSNKEEAEEFKKAMPEDTEIYFDAEKDKWFIKRKKGTTIKVLRAVKIARNVAGQIPDGWDPTKYGIPKDLVKQVDRITLFNIITTAESYIRAGMDPFELYQYLHPRLVGSTMGSGMGGMEKLKNMYTDFVLDRKRQHDALQEALINVTSAWAITSYVGCTGPIETPVSACATAGVSIEMAMNLIEEGKAKFMIAGAFDDLSEDGMIGFGDMDATASSEKMATQGISPSRMCRPNDVRRGGFLEAQGGGAVLLARGDLVLEMGLPVYGIMGYAATHSDGIQASIPAPGQGVVAAAAETGSHPYYPKKDRDLMIAKLENDSSFKNIFGDEKTVEEMKKVMKNYLLHNFYKGDDRISPIRGALSVYGLTTDDIALVYKHDTATEVNDYNENKLHNNIQKFLGRSEGNPLLVVSQKSLTGHSKGGAAAWQIIGLMQSMNEGIISGNKNLEDVDSQMDKFAYITFTDEKINVGRHRIKAGLLTTLGFGHVGAICLVLHSDFYLAALNKEERDRYLAKRKEREKYTIRRYHESRIDITKPMYTRKLKGPFKDDDEETKIFVSPLARIKPDHTY